MDINLDSTKLRLIQLIMTINDDDALVELEKKASEVSKKVKTGQPNIELAVKPILSNVTLDEIDKRQNYHPISYKEFRKRAAKLNLKESIEELLNLSSLRI